MAEHPVVLPETLRGGAVEALECHSRCGVADRDLKRRVDGGAVGVHRQRAAAEAHEERFAGFPEEVGTGPTLRIPQGEIEIGVLVHVEVIRGLD